MSNEITPLPLLKSLASDSTNGYSTSAEMTKSLVSAGVTGFISATGLLCNLVVILVICILKDYKKTTHWYVLNLAMADSIFLIMLPFNLVQSVFGKWMFGLPLCVLFQGAFYVNYYAGVLFLAVMSFDRYVAIAHPVSQSWGRLRSTAGSRLMSLAVWTVAIGATVPLMANTTVDGGVCDFSFESIHPDCKVNKIPGAQCQLWLKLQNSDEATLAMIGSGNATEGDQVKSVEEYLYDILEDGYEDTYEEQGFIGETAVPADFTLPDRQPGIDYNCQHDDSVDYMAWVVGNFVLSFVLPLSVMACCYGAILWRIQHPKVRASGLIVGKSRRHKHAEKSGSSGIDKKFRITVLVVSLVAVFIICWTPFHAVVLAKIPGIPLPSEVCTKLKDAAVVTAYSNSLLNPILYTFLGINFGKRLQKACCRVLGRTSSVHRNSVRSGNRSFSSAGTKLARVSFTSEQPAGIPMLQIVAASSKSSEHSHSQNGYVTDNSHVMAITNGSAPADSSEKMLGGTIYE